MAGASKYKMLDARDKAAVVMELLKCSNNGKLPKGSLLDASRRWGCSICTIYRIWKRYQHDASQSVDFAPAPRVGRPGPPPATISALQSQIAALPAEKRGDLRTLSAQTGVAKTTLHRYLRRGLLRVASSTLRPALTAQQKKMRMKFALSFVARHNNGAGFDDMYDRVHVDEKWFYLLKLRRRVYLAPAEDAPHGQVQNKRFIPKLMFLCAVARPRLDRQKN